MRWTNQQVEEVIGLLLRWGVIMQPLPSLAAAFGAKPDYHVFRGASLAYWRSSPWPKYRRTNAERQLWNWVGCLVVQSLQVTERIGRGDWIRTTDLLVPNQATLCTVVATSATRAAIH